MRLILTATTALITAACGGGSFPSRSTPTAPTTSNVSPAPTAPSGTGALGGTVTINGEARPIVYVELQGGWAFDTTIQGGSWEWERVPAGDHVVVIKTPPGLTCDATSKPGTVRPNQRTVVNFACVGDVKGSIQGLAINEFGIAASRRIILTGPVNRETVTNRDGFFAFEDLPPGEYLVGPCNQVRANFRGGATAFAMVDCS